MPGRPPPTSTVPVDTTEDATRPLEAKHREESLAISLEDLAHRDLMPAPERIEPYRHDCFGESLAIARDKLKVGIGRDHVSELYCSHG